MKHLKIVGELIPEHRKWHSTTGVSGLITSYSKVKVTVVHQTHFGKEFGEGDEGVDFCYKDLRLVSHNPKVELQDYTNGIPGIRNSFYVIGRGNYHGAVMTRNHCEVSLQDWDRIKSAVIAYNVRFA